MPHNINIRRILLAIMLQVSCTLTTTGCLERESPTEIAPITTNPYQFDHACLTTPKEHLDTAARISDLLVHTGNPYGFTHRYSDWVQDELGLAQNRQSQLNHIVSHHDFRNIGRFIPSLEQIEEGLSFWGEQLVILHKQDTPYWDGQKREALADGRPELIGACTAMVNALALKDTFIVLAIDNLDKDRTFILADSLGLDPGERETIMELAVRNLHEQNAAVTYLSHLAESIDQARGIVFGDWADVEGLIVKSEDINDEIALWESDRSRIDAEEKPYWHHQLEEALLSDNNEWVLFTQHMLTNLDRRDDLASASITDLNCDRILNQDPDSESIQEFICRKGDLTSAQLAYYRDRIAVFVEGMSLGIIGSVN